MKAKADLLALKKKLIEQGVSEDVLTIVERLEKAESRKLLRRFYAWIRYNDAYFIIFIMFFVLGLFHSGVLEKYMPF